MSSAGLSQETTGKVPEGSRRPTTIPAANATLAPSQTLRLGWVELSRQELYDNVWSQPALTFAQEFGISDRGLGKICARFEIPVPPRGYWQNLSAGQRLEKAFLHDGRQRRQARSRFDARRSTRTQQMCGKRCPRLGGETSTPWKCKFVGPQRKDRCP